MGEGGEEFEGVAGRTEKEREEELKLRNLTTEIRCWDWRFEKNGGWLVCDVARFPSVSEL